MELKEVAEYVIQVLKANGVVVQRYNAYSTQSIYLKLDCGVSKSLRISDHRGKPYLRYRYNLIKGGRKRKETGKYARDYATTKKSDVADMIELILYDRQVLIDNLGARTYRYYMENKWRENKDQKGFWSKAKFV